MYKVLVFTNNVKVPVADDFQKATDFFKSKGINVEFSYKDTNLLPNIDFKVKEYSQGWYGVDEALIKPHLIDKLEPNTYHCAMFVWDKDGQELRDKITSWSNWGELIPGTEFIQLCTASYDDQIGHIWKSIAHELVHSFYKRLARSGVVLNDPMDNTYVLQPDGSYKLIPYFKNTEPYAEDGNFSVALTLLKPFWGRITPLKGEYTQMLLPVGTLRRSGRKLDGVKYIVIHDTGNPGSTARENALYYARTANQESASAHTFTDDKETVLVIPLNEKAWHVHYETGVPPNIQGSYANDWALAPEFCFGYPVDTKKSYENYVALIAKLCLEYGRDPNKHLKKHSELDPLRRTDPQNAFNTIGKSWNWFIVDVAVKMYPPKITHANINRLLTYLKNRVQL